MAKTGIKLTGVHELIASLEKIEGDLDKSAEKVVDRAGDILREELVSAMKNADKSGGMKGLISRMPPNQKTGSGNRYTVRVGYIPTEYDPQNLSDYFKAMFLNFGTPHRSEHGQVVARQFVKKAKKAAKKRLDTLSEKYLAEQTKEIKK